MTIPKETNMALTQNQLQSIIDLVRRDPEARRQLQAALQIDPLLALPSSVERLDEKLERVAEMLAELTAAHLRAQARLEGVEERLERVEARLEGVEERLTRLEQTVQKLADAQIAMQQQLAILTGEVRKVSSWQFGDEGRRKGEQYQRKIELQAFRLLGEGQGGGLARDRVYERINALMARLPDLNQIDDESDPTLANR
jgi:predicted nuclease with TOPRIM domain